MPLGQCAATACLLEVCAPKPGNVHRAADFEDMTLADFMVSAAAIAPVIQHAETQPVGRTVWDGVQATRRVTKANTNLGILILIAPLAAVARPQPLADGVKQVLSQLTAADARDVTRAIRCVAPGGLDPAGHTVDGPDDVHDPNGPTDLIEAMRQAASWDLIARQYVNQFDDVLHGVLPWLLESDPALSITDRIVETHVRVMAEYPDSLIGRKCGIQVAEESAARAARVIQAGPFGSPPYYEALSDLDFWLRADGNRRNPGTTADLIAAALFVALRDGVLDLP